MVGSTAPPGVLAVDGIRAPSGVVDDGVEGGVVGLGQHVRTPAVVVPEGVYGDVADGDLHVYTPVDYIQRERDRWSSTVSP